MILAAERMAAEALDKHAPMVAEVREGRSIKRIMDDDSLEDWTRVVARVVRKLDAVVSGDDPLADSESVGRLVEVLDEIPGEA